MNQGATEVLLALKLADRMAGTAYLDDEIWPEMAEDFGQVPILSDRYPDIDTLMAAQPDFIYGSYASAFANGTSIHYASVLGDCDLVVPQDDGSSRMYCREELHERSIQTYLQEPYCELPEYRPDTTTVDVLYDEIWDLANIFDAHDQARELVDSIEEHFSQAQRVTATSNQDLPPIKVLWLDGWSEETPFVGACCGSVQLILENAGAENIFANQGIHEKKSWDRVTWDEVAALDPDLIVLVDASWDKAGTRLM